MSDDPAASVAPTDPYRHLVQEAEDMLYMMDAQGRYVLVNDSFVEKTGYPRSELIGATPDLLLSEADVQKGQRRAEELVDADRRSTETYTVDLVTAGGDSFPCEIRFSLLPLDDGSYTGMVGVARDISRRRRRDQQLQVLTRVLRHNIRNKLGVVMGEAELLRSRTTEGHSPTAAQVEDATRTIESTARELVRLSEKVRTIQEGIRSGSDGPMRTDAALVARSTVAKLTERFPEATIEYDGPDSVWVRATDSLAVALEELIENGVEHHGGEGEPRVAVRVDAIDGEVRLAVTDHCPRLPAAERRVIRAAEETDLQHSAGVGLWLVYWVCTAANGELSFEYTGDGNRIVLTLDAATAP